MRNKKYDYSKIFIICRTEGQIKYVQRVFQFTTSEKEAHFKNFLFKGDVCFRMTNNKYQGFAYKDFYLKEYRNHIPVEFTKYFIPTFVEIDENE